MRRIETMYTRGAEPIHLGRIRPAWKRDGRELFYRAGERIMAVAINASQTFEARAPVELFETRTADPNAWTPSADGKRFLVSRPTDDRDPTPITVIVNWTDGLNN